MTSLEQFTWEQAHRYVLFNSDIIEPYIKEHEVFVYNHARHGLGKWNKAKDQCLTFHEWLEDHVRNSAVSEEVKWLSKGPNNVARRFSPYVINGYKFVIEGCERKTQNSGVMVTSSTLKFKSDLENVDMEGQLRSPMPDQPMVNEDENVGWVRDDIPGMTVDTCVFIWFHFFLEDDLNRYHDFMESKKDKFSRPRDIMKNIIGDQGEQIPHLSKRYKASRPSSSMEDIIGEQAPRLNKRHKVSCSSMEDIIGETSFMESKKRFSRPRDTMKNIISDQGEKTPQMSKRHKASRPSSSMEDIIGELEEIASSPCQMPLAPQRINHEGEATLSTYLGTLARNAHFAPLIYTSWKGLKENWEDMWQTVTSKFDIEERAKKWVLQTICSSWRSHKCRLKNKYFKPNMNDEYNLKNRPSIVPLEQWKILIKYWKSDLAKARSMKNRISRAKLTSMHTTGSKTFAEIHHEETMNNPDGREPSHVEMYIMTHKPKNGNPMNEGTRRIMSELEDVIASHPKELEQSTAHDDIFSQILGKDKPGHVRTYGKWVVPSDIWGPRSMLETQKIIEEVRRNAETEIQIMQEKIKEEVEGMKVENLGGLKFVLNELQKCFRGVTIPNLSSIFIPTVNKGAAVDAHSTANTHHANVREGKSIPNNVEDQMDPTHCVNIGSKKRKKDKAHKKRHNKGK
ncbi:putative transposase, Ptta/En/Spm, plant [Sesbania bispinosa]|nr:putative transposase, Ptta/En/Spm, plant [Sesbania bispinosa]